MPSPETAKIILLKLTFGLGCNRVNSYATQTILPHSSKLKRLFFAIILTIRRSYIFLRWDKAPLCDAGYSSLALGCLVKFR